MTIMNVMMGQERDDEGRDCRISQKSKIIEGIFNIIVLFFFLLSSGLMGYVGDEEVQCSRKLIVCEFVEVRPKNMSARRINFVRDSKFRIS